MEHLLLLLAALQPLLVNTTCTDIPILQFDYEFHYVAGAPLPQLDIYMTVQGRPRVTAILKPHNIPLYPEIRVGSETLVVLRNIPYGAGVEIVLAYNNCSTVAMVDTSQLQPPRTEETQLVDTSSHPERIGPKLVTRTSSHSGSTTDEAEGVDWLNVYVLLLAAGFALSAITAKLVKSEEGD